VCKRGTWGHAGYYDLRARPFNNIYFRCLVLSIHTTGSVLVGPSEKRHCSSYGQRFSFYIFFDARASPASELASSVVFFSIKQGDLDLKKAAQKDDNLTYYDANHVFCEKNTNQQ
jgi:hypothetical protein